MLGGGSPGRPVPKQVDANGGRAYNVGPPMMGLRSSSTNRTCCYCIALFFPLYLISQSNPSFCRPLYPSLCPTHLSVSLSIHLPASLSSLPPSLEMFLLAAPPSTALTVVPRCRR